MKSGERLIVIGGGEHARVVIESAKSQGWDIAGVVDKEAIEVTCTRLGVERLGDDTAVLANLSKFGNVAFVLGIGSVGASPSRLRIIEKYTAANVKWATIIHARAWVSPTAHLGEGTVVFAGAMLNTGVRAGRHCILNTGAIVEHDVVLGDFVQVAPGSAIGGGASIADGTYIGLGSRIRDHVRVGSRVTVGMGAVVVSNLPDEIVAVGVPARAKPSSLV